ncbi:hypothetical protein CJF42_02990 [Pseudoalteromonas sp. NBT06-2]|uniref:RNA polymerase sigma factor n=1 Tax=Pseudoalteromonas sp. NBT06-2 TaxID=2025950 RepID=UPI000BA5A78A|nr:sigma-70 family RNA polymerase sigma factor [Pseudoalteromonas sp. NBT06-2]PAJ75821.1 hypothetical protein CJF42_02990 [Pseudoalteromonas sp. NBT06-2]
MEQAKIELLVMDAKQADEQAFTLLFQHFNPGLLRFAYKISKNEQLTHDAVQNAWIKITKSLKNLQDPRAFKSWAYQATRWQTLDLVKQQAKESALQVDEPVEALAQVKNENDGLLLHHINELPDIDKHTIHLFYLEQMSLQEVSLVLEIPIGTVKSRLNRARKLLKQKIAKVN